MNGANACLPVLVEKKEACVYSASLLTPNELISSSFPISILYHLILVESHHYLIQYHFLCLHLRLLSYLPHLHCRCRILWLVLRQILHLLTGRTSWFASSSTADIFSYIFPNLISVLYLAGSFSFRYFIAILPYLPSFVRSSVSSGISICG